MNTVKHAQIEATIAQIVVDAAEALDPTPERVIRLAPGEEVAWDECCDGYLWARLMRVNPITDQAQQAGRPCKISGYIATIELGILRCAHVLDDQGVAPKPHEIESDGLRTVRDMETLANVLACSDIRSLGDWAPFGVMGGCAGGFWTFTLRFKNCAEC